MAFITPISSPPPLPTPSDWVRPSDWIAITDSPNEVQFLVCDLGTKAFTIRTTFTRTSGNIYIDWGDGVIDTISTTTQVDTSHVYSTGGTPCSRGYNTWKIRIYGDPTCVITNARHVADLSAAVNNPFYSIGLLEAYFGDNTCTTTGFYINYFNSGGIGTNGLGSFTYLEYVKLPSVVSWTDQMASMFRDCVDLYKVIMPTSASSLTTLGSAFENCTNILEVNVPSNAINIVTLLNAFRNCVNINKITLPTTLNSCTSISNLCYFCSSLKNITLPSINSLTNMSYAFYICDSLQWVKFTSFPSPASVTAINATSIFQECRQLQNVYLPSSCSSNANFDFSFAFIGCRLLKNIQLPSGFSASTLNTTFANCNSLTYIGLPSTMNTLSNLTSAFNSCWALTSITLPTTISASSVSLANAFANCYSLTSITVPSSYNISSLTFAFQNCLSLESIVLPNNSQNSCTVMNNMVENCYRLRSIVMPTSMTAIGGINGSVFRNCYNLTSVTLPTTMNSLTSMTQFFQNCYNLTSVTLPTSVSSCTNFSSMFQNCRNIETIVMPATVSASTTTFASAFSSCFALKTLTLPTTQMTSVNTISSMLYACSNLTTINNLNRIGSLTSTPLVNGTLGAGQTALYTPLVTSLSFSCPFSTFSFIGGTPVNRLNSLRLLNTGAGQYTGISPHITVSNNDLGVAALNQLFTDLPTVTAKTINIAGCTGSAGCTRSIATAKGWTVTG